MLVLPLALGFVVEQRVLISGGQRLEEVADRCEKFVAVKGHLQLYYLFDERKQ